MTANIKDPIFRYRFQVPPLAIDENGHANNVQFVQWMQDVAVRHYESLGGLEPTQTLGATWVVRSHRVVYLAPAFEADWIEACTWVVNLRKVRSLRRYQFTRVSDGKILVTGETDWVFVEVRTGRLLAIPPAISDLFPLLEDGSSDQDHPAASGSS
jgi:acyl-CoA thioester hydrolase